MTFRHPLTPRSRGTGRLLAASWLFVTLAHSSLAEAPSRPDIVIVTVDALRYDRLSIHGYPRPTSPEIDRLMAAGIHFTAARVVEPLTSPSMCSMVTSLHPHAHGSSRNGLRLRPGLPSLGKVIQRRGYRTAAFVSNWTLKDELSGLGEHFEDYNEVFTRKRYFGLFAGEATGEDLTDAALEWLDDHLHPTGEHGPRPFLLWVHYVEPHLPYRFHTELAPALGIRKQRQKDISASDRYDTEVAFVDRAIGRLLQGLRGLPQPPLIVFASDHGESLGEHRYWGHGRHLYEVTLRIPLSFTWEGQIEPGRIDAPATLLDVAPTLFGLAGWPVPAAFQGYDWSAVIRGEAAPPLDRVTRHQAHKGAALHPGNEKARRQGLLEVARVEAGKKEILRVTNDNHRLFDLTGDRHELTNLVPVKSAPSDALKKWLEAVREGLRASDDLPVPDLDEESVEKLRALGYID